MNRTIEIIGIPTSAASYAPGQEKAPAALRAAGLVEGLRAAGYAVVDRKDDPPVWRWRPDATDARAQNLAPTIEYVGHTRKRVARALAEGNLALVLGGNCTIELGVVAAHLDAGQRIGLVYLDAHADMNVPDAVSDGALDWMGVAHMLDIEGARRELADIGPCRPLLRQGDLALLGFDPGRATQFELGQIKELGLDVVAWNALARDPDGETAKLLDRWSARFDRLLVHFDVDVLDFFDAPLSEDTTGRGTGLTLDQTARSLAVLAADPRLSALTIAEVNPAHGAEDGSTIRALVAMLGKALGTVGPGVSKADR